MSPVPGSESTIPPIAELIDEDTRAFLREAIAENRGDEVFFLARSDAQGVLREAIVAARGHDWAAPAITTRTDGFHCAIHNHPGGDLRPSDADLGIASELGNAGVGFYIVDNEVGRCLPVVPVRPPEPRVPLDEDEIEALIGPDGPLAARVAGYEARPEQVAMARAVARALARGQVLLVEAGTGTGKSLAYLLPAIVWAVRRREKVIASTATINLQEQLVGKDIPLLAAGEGLPEMRSALVKGRGNYVSIRRAKEAEAGKGELFEEAGERAALEQTMAWLQSTRTGDRADLPHPPPEEVWERVESTPDNCLRARCPTYGKCFYFAARHAAARSDLLVANHHLLFSDLAIKAELGDFSAAAVLPAFRHVVLDEAHHVEDTASSYFGSRVTTIGLRRLLGRMVARRRAARGVLPAVARKCVISQDEHALRTAALIDEELLPLHARVLEGLEADLAAVREAVARAVPERRGPPPAEDGGGEAVAEGGGRRPAYRRHRLRPPAEGETLWAEIAPPLGRARTRLVGLGKALGAAAAPLEGITDLDVRDRLAGAALDLRALSRRCANAAGALELFLEKEDVKNVRWVELRPRRGKARPGESDAPELGLHTAPLEIGPVLREKLFDRVHAAVLCSATLAVAGRFDFLRKRLGLADLPEGRVAELRLGSPFDYARHCAVGVPTHMPDPGASGWEEAVRIAVREAVTASRGRAFVLFTSWGLLRRTHAALAPTLRERGLLPLVQGEMSRSRLLERFRGSEGAVLFGTDSFWEGVDVKGDALSLVIITRLPFRVPDEPLWQARAERIAAGGGDPFTELTVPQAVLKFRQGFGRLIRSKSDRGAILILDRRVITRRYGRAFLDSLPDGVRVHEGRFREVMGRLSGVIDGGS